MVSCAHALGVIFIIIIFGYICIYRQKKKMNSDEKMLLFFCLLKKKRWVLPFNMLMLLSIVRKIICSDDSYCIRNNGL